MKKIGILREEKQPVDTRTPLTPSDCKDIIAKYKYEIFIQPSSDRCYTNAEYEAAGVKIQESMFECDAILGVKEVPIHYLIPGKRYLFFSHTIKKQAHNLKLIQAFIDQKIEMIDYEALTDDNGQRLVAFGYWAGIVGGFDCLWMIQKKMHQKDIGRIYLNGYNKINDMLHNLEFKSLKFLVTGTGRVAKGVIDIMEKAKIKRVSPDEFLNKSFNHAVYTQLSSKEMFAPRMPMQEFNREEFFERPQMYRSIFEPYTRSANVLINAMYWDQKAPKLFTLKEMKKNDFSIEYIADITCDIAPEASIPSTVRPTTIENPVFGFLPLREKIVDPFMKKAIDIMAIPNLPSEVPREASADFSKGLTTHIIPVLFDAENPIIKRATVTKKGKLTDEFLYLESFVYEDEFRAAHIK
jgi:saccharopine dehydrogenase (NAD+, L-lysine-forming)